MSLAKHPEADGVANGGGMTEGSTVFDAVADDYDADFTNTHLGRMLRRRVWSILARHFAAGDRVLELACGTGEDAIWLAKRGVRVTATDGSAKMIRVTGDKVARNGLAGRVTVQQWSLEQMAGGREQGASSGWREADAPQYDGVFSNFGGLNALGEWRPLAEALSGQVKGGGKLVLAPMGPYCPWEIGWHLAHGLPGAAFRRLRGRATAKVARRNMTLWYPSAARLRRDFAPWFRYVEIESLGLWLPPTYLGHLVERWPGPFARLNRLEKASARFSGGWGDHFVIVFERNE
jgi:SAM-dependent methyltransferase